MTDGGSIARAAAGALLAHHRAAGDELLGALFAGECGAAISELSVSYRPSRPVTVRALSEIVERRALDRALAARGLEWVTALLQRIGADAALFGELYELVYVRNVDAPAPLFRFGLALELGAEAPVLKSYFDLFAVQPERRRETLERIAALVDNTSGLQSVGCACPAIDLATTRVIGVDFAAGRALRSKFYWSARRMQWDELVDAARDLAGDGHLATVQRLGDLFGRDERALSAMLVSICAAGDARAMKIDVCLPALYQNDAGAREAVERFRGCDDATPFTLLSGGLDPRATRCIHQYLGVELPRDAAARTTVYYRPLGVATAYLSPALTPGRCG